MLERDSDLEYQPHGRRKPSGGVSAANAVGGFLQNEEDDAHASPDWYSRILLAKRNESQDDRSTTFALPSDLEVASGLNTTVPFFNATQLILRGRVIAGVLRDRTVLAWARVQVEGEIFMVARESVQPYNFSLESKTRISFVTPPRSPDYAAGFAEVKISADGPEVVRPYQRWCGRPMLRNPSMLKYSRLVYVPVPGVVIVIHGYPAAVACLPTESCHRSFRV
jgi:hypothetical protein